MKIKGLVKNKVLPRIKTITDENDIDKLIMSGGIRDLDEYIDDLMRQRNNTQEALFGGIPNDSYKNTESTRSLFTKEAIQAARMASGFNQKRDDDYER